MKRAMTVLLKSILVATVLCLAGSRSGCPKPPDTQKKPLRICVIDVDQGDAILLISPGGKVLLVDGGNRNYGKNEVNPLLDSLGITHLDCTFASHYDADHIGGLDEVVVHVTPDSLLGWAYDRGHSKESGQFDEYVQAVGGKRKTIAVDEEIPFDDATVTCVAVNGKLKGGDSVAVKNENDYGVCLVVKRGSFTMFLPGDISGDDSGDHRDVETRLAPQIGDVAVYKVSHHASRYSSNQTLLNALKPEVSVISVGDNSYGHPCQETIDRLASANSRIYQTNPGPAGTGIIPDGGAEL